MDVFKSHLYIHESSSSQQLAPSVAISRSSSSFLNFPIIAIAVIGILATAFLLISYYIIVIKCCLNLHRFSATQDADDALMMHSPAAGLQQPKGLDQWAINSIPIVEFNKAETESLEQSLQECPVCLAEFQVSEKLRCLQDCSHLFHMDCIDVWLQNNGNCPLCRTSISYTIPSTTPPRLQDLTTAETTTCVDTDFVVIEIQQQLEDPGNQPIITHHPHMPQKVLELRDTPKKQGRKKHQMLSMGDECIDVGVKDDDVFKIQPIRRSISMDSSNNRLLYLMVQDVINRQQQQQQQRKCGNVVTPGDQGCSSGGTGSRLKRSFFSFGCGRGCKCSAVLPAHTQP